MDTYILAYNLIRTIIAQAAAKHDIEPRAISFKGAVQTLAAYAVHSRPVVHAPSPSNALARHASDNVDPCKDFRPVAGRGA